MVIILLSIYLIFIHQTQSMILNFETASNSSQMIDLENLIGSFHTYASDSSQLFIRDMGLTNGQKKLLKRYKNIKIISSTYISSKNRQKIDVNQEFIQMNNTLYHRNNQRKYQYLNMIHKQISLVIVIPYIESQIDQLKSQLNTNTYYPPCRNHSINSIDLIFYSNKKSSIQFNYTNPCYKNIYYISADLIADEDRYPIGSANMWKKLFINEQLNSLSLRARGYTHFFLMEPDTRPIRSYWLDTIVDLIVNGYDHQSYLLTKWWIIGSLYRGTIPIGNEFLHINGNALYHLSLDLIEFIENVAQEYPYDSKQSWGYDLDLFLYLFKHIDQAKKHWHKFQFNDFIQNCWHSGCNDTNIEFIHNNPNTYLIHGYKIEQIKTKYSLKKFFYIAILGFILLILNRFRHYRRKLFCKRNNFKNFIFRS